MPLARQRKLGIFDFSSIADEIEEGIREFEILLNMDLGNRLVRTARRLATQRMPSQGGSYRRSIKYRHFWRGNELRAVLYSDHEFASHVEVGTRPHIIRPKEKNALRIRQRLGQRTSGTPRYVEVDEVYGAVHHPGARAFHIFRDTFRLLEDRIDDIINNALTEAGFE
ncbi:MAG: hypothetical protein ACTSVD_10660 [Candidatus Thorarchaeota archaeon]